MTNGMIVDTSVWIDYFNGVINSKTDIANSIINAKRIIFIPVIAQELLQGIKYDRDFEHIKLLITGFPFINVDGFSMAVAAALIYRKLRKEGITIRRQNDCLIAAICIDKNLSLLHNDKDFTQIAKYTNLKIYNTNT